MGKKRSTRKVHTNTKVTRPKVDSHGRKILGKGWQYVSSCLDGPDTSLSYTSAAAVNSNSQDFTVAKSVTVALTKGHMCIGTDFNETSTFGNGSAETKSCEYSDGSKTNAGEPMLPEFFIGAIADEPIKSTDNESFEDRLNQEAVVPHAHLKADSFECSQLEPFKPAATVLHKFPNENFVDASLKLKLFTKPIVSMEAVVTEPKPVSNAENVECHSQDYGTDKEAFSSGEDDCLSDSDEHITNKTRLMAKVNNAKRRLWSEDSNSDNYILEESLRRFHSESFTLKSKSPPQSPTDRNLPATITVHSNTSPSSDDESLSTVASRIRAKKTNTRKTAQESDYDTDFAQVSLLHPRPPSSAPRNDIYQSRTATPQSSTALSVSDTDIDHTNIGTILVQGGVVNFNLQAIIHKGSYNFQATILDGMYVTTIYRKDVCVSVSHETCEYDLVETAPCIITRSEGSIGCAAACCLPKGHLVGNEIAMAQKNMHLASMLYKYIVKAPEVQPKLNLQESAIKVTKNRKHYCLFCNKLVTCFGHHIRATHPYESSVAKITLLPIKSQARNDAIKALRLQGDKMHNLICKTEEQIFVRNPNVVSKSVTCNNCGALLSEGNFSRHDRMCKNRDPTGIQCTKAARLATYIEKRKLTENSIDEADLFVDKLLHYLRDDNIKQLILGDEVLLAFAVDLANRYRADLAQAKNARQNLRQCARLLTVLRELDPSITNITKALVPEKYKVIIKAIDKDCKLRVLGKEKPATAVHYNLLIKKMAQVCMLRYIEIGRDQYKNEINRVRDFVNLHTAKFVSYISKVSFRLLVERRSFRKAELPSPEDTIRFGEYIRNQAHDSYERLQNRGYEYQNWRRLGESVMLQLLFLNRRRVGEISKVLLKSFLNHEMLSESETSALDTTQTILAKNLRIMKIIGKRARILPILMTLSNIQHLELFISFRTSAGVRDDNKYLFALPRQSGFIDACTVMREFSEMCGALNPTLLRGTLLRKQVATLTQLVAMDENDIQQLADFMGHDISVHKSIYRTPANFLQITKMSRIFMAISKGDLQKYKGKSIDEIEVELGERIKAAENLDNLDIDADIDDLDLPDSLLPDDYVSESNEQQKSAQKSNKTVAGVPSTAGTPSTPRTGSKRTPSTPGTASKRKSSTISQILQEIDGRKRRQKLMWKSEEKKLIKYHFKECFQHAKLQPTNLQTERFAEKYKVQLRHRSGRTLNQWIREEKKRIQRNRASTVDSVLSFENE